ncbi:alpha-soluble NSF attachment protein-like [Synchiropus splendidus]|uniref:alpha-soluble NSF attachment protein-like n=1 Tax=Synchiropus splendidus TaxID=270530 RepID=UPI00237E8798|nr:alpha-soluble NSF attachment protein-like [Synchiropus splendidus]
MDHSGKEQEAEALKREADKKASSVGALVGRMFGGSSKPEEACDLYIKAANMFKMTKNWTEAGKCFSKAGRIHQQSGRQHEAANDFINAGNAYKKVDPKKAVELVTKAIHIYTDMGRFTTAAKHHMTLGEICETQLDDVTQAVVHYQQAADYYKGEESTSSANNCLLKVAAHVALQYQYQRAVQIYEQIGTYCMDSPLLKYSAKDHFFKAALCHFCIDMLNAKLAVQRYQEMFPAFSDCRECKLLKKLLEASEEGDVDAFTNAVKQFESITRLEPWASSLLLRVKDTIRHQEIDLR